jgi:hypothetical protein
MANITIKLAAAFVAALSLSAQTQTQADWNTQIKNRLQVPSALITAIGQADTAEAPTGVFSISTTPTLLSTTTVTAGKPWRLLFMGQWTNNQQGTNLAQVAPIVEFTSASPTVAIGTVNVTVSLNGSNQFQIATDANRAGFSGRIIIIPNNLGAAGATSLLLKDSVQTSGTMTASTVTSPAFVTSVHSDRQTILSGTADFEGTSAIPPPGWNLTGTPTLSYETVSPAPGKLQSLKVVAPNLSGVRQANFFSVVSGDTYSITGQAKSDGTGIADIGIIFADKNGTFLTSVSATTTSTSWVTLTATGTVPANAVSGQVFLEQVFAGTQTVWFDTISVQKTNFPAPLVVSGGGGGGFTVGSLANSNRIDTNGSTGRIYRFLDSGNGFDGSEMLGLTMPGTTTTGAGAGVADCRANNSTSNLECSYNNGAYSGVPLLGLAQTWTGLQTFTGPVTSSAFVASTHGDRQVILANPDFEVSSIIPPPGWTLTGSATLSYETVSPAPGKNQSLKVAATASFSGVLSGSFYSIVPGDTYTISCSLKSDGTAQASCVILFLDKTGAIVNPSVTTAGTFSTSWITQSASGVAPATAIQLVVKLQNNAATGTVWFDDILVQKVTFPSVQNSCATSQTTVTQANTFPDTILTCGIPAQAGSYRMRFTASISAASNATLGWTATWTDANGTAFAPTNLAVFNAGGGTPGTTQGPFNGTGDIYGAMDVDVNNSGGSISVKLTFSGTSFTAKASATVERII